MIPCELDLTSTPFYDTKILTYEIELPPSGKKIDINLLDDEYFTMTYVIDTIPNSLAGHQLPTQANKKIWVVAINREDTITAEGMLDELQIYHTRHVKSKVNISLCIRNNHQRIYLKEIRSIFDQIRPMVSYIEVLFSEKPPNPKNIVESIKGPQRQF